VFQKPKNITSIYYGLLRCSVGKRKITVFTRYDPQHDWFGYKTS